MRRADLTGTFLLVLMVAALTRPPTEACARPHASTISAGTLRAPGTCVVQAGAGGYVDMRGDDATGDRFVDEDGDGLDDRHLRRHQKRSGRRWRDDDGRGHGSHPVESGSSGQRGHGSGPGRGGR